MLNPLRASRTKRGRLSLISGLWKRLIVGALAPAIILLVAVTAPFTHDVPDTFALALIISVALIALRWGLISSLIALIEGAITLAGIIILGLANDVSLTAWSVTDVGLFIAALCILGITSNRLDRARKDVARLDDWLNSEGARFETVLDAVTEALVIRDRTGAIMRMNRAASTLFPGIEPGATPPHDGTADLILPDGTPLGPDALPFKRALHGEIVSDELVLLPKSSAPRQSGAIVDGEPDATMLLVSAAPIHTEDGAIYGSVTVLKDITALRRSERLAAQHASALEAIFNTIADGIFAFDTNRRMTQTNQAALSILGLTREEFIGVADPATRGAGLDIRSENGERLTAAESVTRRVLAGETMVGPTSVDHVIRRPDGRNTYLNISAAPVHDHENTVIGGVITMRDMTARYALERRAHETLAALLDMTAMLQTITAGAGGRPLDEHLGQRFCELTQRVLGCQRVTLQYVQPEQPERVIMLALANGSEDEHTDWRTHLAEGVELPEGLIRWLRAHAVDKPVAIPASVIGAVMEVYGFPPIDILAAPITVQRRQMAYLTVDFGMQPYSFTQGQIDLVQGVARILSAALEGEWLRAESEAARAEAMALQRTTARMDEFLGIASHELRTPLTTIKASVQIALRRLGASNSSNASNVSDGPNAVTPASSSRPSGPLEDDLRDTLHRADRQIGRLNRLIDGLLDASRVGMGRLHIDLEDGDLTTLVHEAVNDAQLRAPERVIRVTGDNAPIPLRADSHRIFQVISAYISNAIKFSVADQPIHVAFGLGAPRGAGHSQHAWVTVRDFGPGIPEDLHERVWERFYQNPALLWHAGSEVGLGLGLYLCRAIIEAHQGDVGVQSPPGGGALFWFSVPIEPQRSAHITRSA